MDQNEYNEILQEMNSDPIADAVIRENYGLPLDVIYYKIEEAYIKNTSSLLFPDDRVLFYPSYREYKAKIFITLLLKNMLFLLVNYILIMQVYL